MGPDSAVEAQALAANVCDKPLGSRCDICPCPFHLPSEAPLYVGHWPGLGTSQEAHVPRPCLQGANVQPGGEKMGTAVEGRGALRKRTSPRSRRTSGKKQHLSKSLVKPPDLTFMNRKSRPVLPSSQLWDLWSQQPTVLSPMLCRETKQVS